MDAPQQNLISQASQQAKALLGLYELSRELDTLYEGAPNWQSLITQDAINSVPSFVAAGLTVADVSATIFILKTINAQIDTINLPAFIKLAHLG